jgi:MoaA/NifB/PqqE/SkfB family radical SAM enzyme
MRTPLSWARFRPLLRRFGLTVLKCVTYLPPGLKHRLKHSRLARRAHHFLASAPVSPDRQVPNPLCVLPWIHAHIATTGDVHLCCAALGQGAPLGNVHQRSLFEVFASGPYNKVRQQMLQGKWPWECQSCKDRELMGLSSYRHFSNGKFPSYFGLLTSNPGALTPAIRSIDLRPNNICNFKCRSCGVDASNRWVSDHNLIHPEAKVLQGYQGFDKSPAFWAEFDEKILPGLEELDLAGGEPSLSQSHYLLLERLISLRKNDIRLQLVTNLSQLRFMHWDAVELWKQFPNLELALSLDGVGAQGEYIRKGMSYDTWVANALRLKRELPHARRCLHFVVSIFNVTDLREHCETILQGEFVDPANITFTFLKTPVYMSVQVLTPELKSMVERDIRVWLSEARQMPAVIRKQIEALIDFMKETDGYTLYGREFVSKTRLLDQARGENALALFPKLRPMQLEKRSA